MTAPGSLQSEQAGARHGGWEAVRSASLSPIRGVQEGWADGLLRGYVAEAPARWLLHLTNRKWRPPRSSSRSTPMRCFAMCLRYATRRCRPAWGKRRREMGVQAASRLSSGKNGCRQETGVSGMPHVQHPPAACPSSRPRRKRLPSASWVWSTWKGEGEQGGWRHPRKQRPTAKAHCASASATSIPAARPPPAPDPCRVGAPWSA